MYYRRHAVSLQEFTSVHLINVGQHQASANPQTKHTDLGCYSVCKLLLYAHHCCLLLLG